jgi:hypothetical protein
LKRKSLIILTSSIAAVALIGGGGIYLYVTQFAPQTAIQTNPDAINCRQGNVLDGVVRPARFTVISTCEAAIGIVHDMKGTKEIDGDYEFSLDVEQPYKKLLNGQNYSHRNGMLVVEIIPKDQNPSATIQIPKNGDRIEVHGAWVTDKPAYGWNEIHPAWMVKVLS